MTISIHFDCESQVKLNKKAEHMKVKVTQEDTLHSKMFFYHIYIINCYCPLAFITMQAYDIYKAYRPNAHLLYIVMHYNGIII